MLLVVEERVDKIEEYMEDVKESESVQELLNSHRKKLVERNNTLKVMVMALKEETMATTKALSIRIEELERELSLCRATVGNRVLSVALNCNDVLKSKEFVGTRFAYNVDNLLWRIEHYFSEKGRSLDERLGGIRTWEEFQHELKG
ncbi:hypothetical protein Gogos_015686 [Gossypium gossypioides]|uniref:Uncharacterized protein n=1 Tax=Gossypium gossypioides TaxID=34282 RepID=A0A7J9C2F2_GOSGO|nr:hypothetical protein [Gossypium gossypioides]